MKPVPNCLLFCLALMNTVGVLDQDVLELVAERLALLQTKSSNVDA
jgi:hypothetical protein